MQRYKFQVEVHPQYLPEQSEPDGGLYVFAYTITITNVGTVAAQLISRTWNVNDSDGMHGKSARPGCGRPSAATQARRTV
jgi:ApaG protein